MAGLTTARNGGVNAEPNVVPLIDILFVLLIIFIVLNLKVRPVADLQLPAAATVPRGLAPTQIVLELTSSGGFAINGQAVPDARLDETLRLIYADRPTKLLFIKAASGRAYQEVITAIGRARGAGVQVIAMIPRR